MARLTMKALKEIYKVKKNPMVVWVALRKFFYETKYKDYDRSFGDLP